MNDKTDRAKAATTAALRERDSANATARKAIGLALAALGDIIGEESLRGLPNLATSSSPYRAVRVLATKRAHYELPKDGRPVMCLNMRGKLVLAKYQEDLTVAESPVEDIRAEWAEDVSEAIVSALDYHMDACGRAEKRYTKLNELSQRIVAALTEGGS